MLFHTWIFVLFFLVFYTVHLAVKGTRLRDAWLLISSYVFYGWWNAWYLLLLFGTSAIDYLMVVLMERCRTRRGRRLWLVVSLVSNFAFLGYFKYSGFITDNLNALLAWCGLALYLPDPVAYPNALLGWLGVGPAHQFACVLLPIGISFHTFQSMSYTIDAYYGRIPMERSLVRFLAFVSFFPQLVAGPIERASNLLPQLGRVPRIAREDVTDGLSLVLVGLFKKLALADYLALYVDKVYGAPAHFEASALAMATVAFGWQIYFDFSGYTDMARGLARMMGYRLMLNFNHPYLATGLGDFWSRWHISLSSWFKDYVYIPLGGNRGGKFYTYRNMCLTMLISGVWHGAAWTFVIWGALHAAGRVLTRELEGTTFWTKWTPKIVKQLLVYLFVTFTWIFFRARSLDDAWTVVSRIATARWLDPAFPVLAMALIAMVWAYQYLYESPARRMLQWAPVKVIMACGMILYLATMVGSKNVQFIYFQF